MNVVGKVGSLISQGVYSVATPFHPFGGAVDVIVVQQQDGTFRSTPWYVRFGKFQGVLKGAEKVVRITVNGVEANFHMYLDNSGEAYFVREVDADKVSESNGAVQDSVTQFVARDDNIVRLEHSASDSGVAQFCNDFDDLGTAQLERSESDTKFYEFQDEQSSLDDSVNLSDYGSTRYDGLDEKNFGEAQASASEVVLVSVDGHMLTAPVSALEQTDENVQLTTPQFHLGPGDGTALEENEEFKSGNNVWVSDYNNKLDFPITIDTSDDVSTSQNDVNALGNPPKFQKGADELFCDFSKTEDVQNVSNQESDPNECTEVEGTSGCNEKGDLFRSCLELQGLATLGQNVCPEETDYSFEARKTTEGTSHGCIEEETPDSLVSKEHEDKEMYIFQPHADGRHTDSQIEADAVEKRELDPENVDSGSISVSYVVSESIGKKEKFGISVADLAARDSLQCATPQDECNGSGIVETQNISGGNIQTYSGRRFEISLCGNELHAGMGLNAAAEVFDAHRISAEEYKSSSVSIIHSGNLVARFGERYLPWEKAAPIILGMAAFGLDLPVEPKDAIPVEQDETSNYKDDDSVATPTSSSRRWRLWPIPFRRVKTLKHTTSNLSNEEVFLDSESVLQNSEVESPSVSTRRIESPRTLFIRTNVPTSEQIASLNLKDGQNMVAFSFSTRVLGKQQVDAHIYLWKWNARVVISDVDGTITKSDVLGQFMPLVGKDWTQSGVAKLFSAIKENGYQLLFLSARAIVQAYLTRNFLLNLKQDGKTLPNGPVVISPDGLFPSLYREVIRRAPHEFKIACLEDIRKLFPPDYNPFYAGFGNRDTDELSYLKMGIPKGKIFIINPKGEVATSHRLDTKSYTSLHTLINDMFPPTSLVEQEDYNAWNFWKMPLPDIDN